LSGIYHDVVKDRLYTDAPQSPRRRSTQTALYQMLASLCRMLGPILSFTADEAWEFVPGRAADSVHLLDWTPSNFTQSETDRATWKTLFAIREFVLPELEKSRQTKIIGKALEAKLELSGSPDALKSATENEDALRELLNVSRLELKTVENAPAMTATVTKAEGQKCERCWHWEIDVGSNAEHPTICGRCIREIGVGVASQT
jgi:isoleucyl-tRNA synthetase